MPEDRREAYYHQRIRETGLRYANFNAQASEVTFNLLYTYEVLLQHIARYMAEFGLSKSTLNILMLLRNGPSEGMQLHDLGSLLLVSRANITGLIDHLQDKGFVQRVIDQNDRRVRFARITPRGEQLLDEFMPQHYANVRTLLQSVSDDDKELLVQLLKKVRTSLATHAEEITVARDASLTGLKK